MTRPIDNRLDRVEERLGAAGAQESAEAARDRRLWRAEAALGEIIRGALARAGIDAANATRLALADEAAATLSAIPDTAQLRHADAGNAIAAVKGSDRTRAEGFAAKIMTMTRNFANGVALDFAEASFAELLAWSLAQEAAAKAAPRSASAAGRPVGDT
jgi:hypothetical protein